MTRPRRVLLRGMNMVSVELEKPSGLHDLEEGAGHFDGRFGRTLSETERDLMRSVQQAFDDGALDRLSPRQRECFTDVIISGDTYEIVAKRYRISRSAVQKYVQQAAEKLRGEIRE